MILPTKRLATDRALLILGADILTLLNEPKTVSRLWDELQQRRRRQGRSASHVSYDWFVLALDLLYAVQGVSLTDGLISKPRLDQDADD